MKSIRKAFLVLLALVAAVCLVFSACRRDQSAETTFSGATFVLDAQPGGDAF